MYKTYKVNVNGVEYTVSARDETEAREEAQGYFHNGSDDSDSWGDMGDGNDDWSDDEVEID